MLKAHPLLGVGAGASGASTRPCRAQLVRAYLRGTGLPRGIMPRRDVLLAFRAERGVAGMSRAPRRHPWRKTCGRAASAWRRPQVSCRSSTCRFCTSRWHRGRESASRARGRDGPVGHPWIGLGHVSWRCLRRFDGRRDLRQRAPAGADVIHAHSPILCGIPAPESPAGWASRSSTRCARSGRTRPLTRRGWGGRPPVPAHPVVRSRALGRATRSSPSARV